MQRGTGGCLLQGGDRSRHAFPLYCRLPAAGLAGLFRTGHGSGGHAGRISGQQGADLAGGMANVLLRLRTAGTVPVLRADYRRDVCGKGFSADSAAPVRQGGMAADSGKRRQAGRGEIFGTGGIWSDGDRQHLLPHAGGVAAAGTGAPHSVAGGHRCLQRL